MRKASKLLARAVGCSVVLALMAVVLAIAAAHPQSSGSAKPAFTVVSVKPSPAGTGQHLAIEPGGRFLAEGVPLNLLVALAYHLQAYQLSGLQPWMNSDQWTIETRADEVPQIPAWAPPSIPDVIAVRLQSLLEDRFRLKAHFETRDLQTYVLTEEKSALKRKPVDPPLALASIGPTGEPPTPQRSAANPTPPPGATLAGGGKIIASAITMNQLVTLLNRLMDRPVIDRTNLAGYYNISLQFDPTSAPRLLGRPPAGVADGSTVGAPPPSDDPSIFVALEQQLGLKPELLKEPVQVLVIDSAQRPTPN